MTGFAALYIVLLAAIAGYGIIARAPDGLHTPLVSAAGFVNAMVLAGAMAVLGDASTTVERIIGFAGVFAATYSAVGGYVVTDRLLELFKASGGRN